MSISFFKIQALGNDFIFTESSNKEKIDVKKICERNFGIGGDGVVFYSMEKNSIRVELVNSDNTVAKNIGNGVLCAAGLMAEIFSINSGIILHGNTSSEYFVENNKISVFFDKAEYIKRCEDHFEIKCGNYHKVFFREKFIESEIREEYNRYRDFNIEFLIKDNDFYIVKQIEIGAGFTLGSATSAIACFSTLNELDSLDECLFKFEGGFLTLSSINNKIKVSGKAEIVFDGNLRSSELGSVQ